MYFFILLSLNIPVSVVVGVDFKFLVSGSYSYNSNSPDEFSRITYTVIPDFKREIKANREKRLPSELTKEIGIAAKRRKKKVVKSQKKTSHIGARPIFIKVDKFKEILESIEVVDRKIKEVEKIIDKLKEVRLKEDQQMASWEQEIEELKKRLEAVGETLSEIE